MPLSAKQFWLDWDTAISIVGHETDVKDTYDALIGSPEAPELFIDIGANYGTHSLLFLVHNVQVLTFEPNPSCHASFREICRVNGVAPTLEPVALGERAGQVELVYPQYDTWFGSTSPDVIRKIASTQEVVTQTVTQKTVDDYFSQIGNKKTLIKIDVEGNELSVLRGATKTLQENKPKIVFECWERCDRIAIFDFFNSLSYRIYRTPWKPGDKAQSLNSNQFINNHSNNFIAITIARCDV